MNTQNRKPLTRKLCDYVIDRLPPTSLQWAMERSNKIWDQRPGVMPIICDGYAAIELIAHYAGCQPTDHILTKARKAKAYIL